MYRFEQNDSYLPVDDYWLFINLVDVHTSRKARFILLHKVDVRGPREENIHLPKTFSRASKSLSQYSRSDDPFFSPEHLANLARSPWYTRLATSMCQWEPSSRLGSPDCVRQLLIFKQQLVRFLAIFLATFDFPVTDFPAYYEHNRDTVYPHATAARRLLS